MTVPCPYQEPKPLDPRLVTKTSLPKPKEAIALLLILWFANGKPQEVEYGCVAGRKDEGGLIEESLLKTIKDYLDDSGVGLDFAGEKDYLKGNPLLESQMESLNSAFELIWHLGTFEFADNHLNRTSERSGGVRYRKRIRFSSNLDLIDILNERDPSAFACVLASWLTSGAVACDLTLEQELIRMLGIFSESAIYKTGISDKGTVFSITGLYNSLLSETLHLSSVEIVDQGENETRGPTRILKNAIGVGLFPPLRIDGNAVSLSDGVDRARLKEYVSRVQVGSQLAHVKLGYTESRKKNGNHAVVSADESWNRVYFGAPGTGKSYQVKQDASLFSKENTTRVTFYPDYTYSQFVGCYKPCTDREGNIRYEFETGPFLSVYLQACTHPYDSFLLIVEEINRANTAAVFGDIFQLLDRSEDGFSEYAISVPEEMKGCISAYLEGLSDDEINQIETYYDPDMSYREFGEAFQSELSLPPNMFIWATMNSADQGVFPMDTAFKRRWDFCYMGINEGENAIVKIAGSDMKLSEITVPCGTRYVTWNSLRHAINEFMASDVLKINEDKLLGPFFISPASLVSDRIGDILKDKVLMYLYEDAAKTKRSKMFRKGLNTYSKVCEAFDNEGENIFGEGFDKNLIVEESHGQAAPDGE